jgi:tetratricopeptide (TPR) repeat protein
VERWLRQSDEAKANPEDVEYARALLRVRDKRLLDAKKILASQSQGEAKLRAQYRMALLLLSDGKFEDSKSAIDAVLGVDPGHSGAALVVAALEKKLAADTPPEDSPDPEPQPPESDDDPTPSIDSYDRLLARADRAAESGNCKQAMRIYEKALDANPSGVAALTGLGYCHLDARQFASAQARFRAALGISRRYQDALWGVAEAYQQQGLKDKAIAAYRKFIEEHPSSKRAAMAERQIERLGGGVAPQPGPEPSPTPTPSPTPAPESSEPSSAPEPSEPGEPAPTPAENPEPVSPDSP